MMTNLWKKGTPEITLSFHSIIASYQSRATTCALVVCLNSLVLSIHDFAQNSVSVAPGRSAVTVIAVSDSSEDIAFENDVTNALVA
jgi:hypothetical protein